MNQPTRKAILLVALIFLIGTLTPAIADTISGKVVSITDGDTLTYLTCKGGSRGQGNECSISE